MKTLNGQNEKIEKFIHEKNKEEENTDDYYFGNQQFQTYESLEKLDEYDNYDGQKLKKKFHQLS